MVRRKVEIKVIEDKSKRHTTFTKRRQGLFKKAKDLCTKCEAETAIITFSKAGNIFAFGHPAVDPVVDRYLSGGSGNELLVRGGNQSLEEEEEEEEELPPLSEVETKIQGLIGKGRQDWDLAVQGLGIDELDEMQAVIEKIKSVAVARAAEVMPSSADEGLNCTANNPIVPCCTLRR